MRTTAKLQDFLSVFEIPDFIKPWIDRFFEDIEIELVMRLADKPLTRNEISRVFQFILLHAVFMRSDKETPTVEDY